MKQTFFLVDAVVKGHRERCEAVERSGQCQQTLALVSHGHCGLQTDLVYKNRPTFGRAVFATHVSPHSFLLVARFPSSWQRSDLLV